VCGVWRGDGSDEQISPASSSFSQDSSSERKVQSVPSSVFRLIRTSSHLLAFPYHLMADIQHTLSMPCIHVAVGSTNPCKLDAVRQAFQEAFSMDIIVMGYDVEVRLFPTIIL